MTNIELRRVIIAYINYKSRLSQSAYALYEDYKVIKRITKSNPTTKSNPITGRILEIGLEKNKVRFPLLKRHIFKKDRFLNKGKYELLIHWLIYHVNLKLCQEETW